MENRNIVCIAGLIESITSIYVIKYSSEWKVFQTKVNKNETYTPPQYILL